mmetsp:Transcript_40366/g.75475  ORF Transcript_40366/g.75475 Transcript_40366/m.75475 type:complete len:235 (+) Transcript_40366:25-729(+)
MAGPPTCSREGRTAPQHPADHSDETHLPHTSAHQAQRRLHCNAAQCSAAPGWFAIDTPWDQVPPLCYALYGRQVRHQSHKRGDLDPPQHCSQRACRTSVAVSATRRSCPQRGPGAQRCPGNTGLRRTRPQRRGGRLQSCTPLPQRSVRPASPAQHAKLHLPSQCLWLGLHTFQQISTLVNVHTCSRHRQRRRSFHANPRLRSSNSEPCSCLARVSTRTPEGSLQCLVPATPPRG